jgi:hypothetical protein
MRYYSDRSHSEDSDTARDSPPSPPSPSRSIPLPASPPVIAVPAEASVSLFKLQPGEAGEEPAAESTRRMLSTESKPPAKRMIPAQQESPTLSFMDTLPALPEPPSEDEIEVPVSAPIPAVRPSVSVFRLFCWTKLIAVSKVNTRLSAHHRIAREPSPASASGSGSEQTPRVSSLMLQDMSPGQSRAPTPPTRVEASNKGLELAGVEPTVTVPKITRTRSRSNTLGTAPRLDVNLAVPPVEIDSAATPVATRWMERHKLRETTSDQGEGSALRDGRFTPKSDTPIGSGAPSPLHRRPSDSSVPMVSQHGKDIIQKMQHSAAALARDLAAEK